MGIIQAQKPLKIVHAKSLQKKHIKEAQQSFAKRNHLKYESSVPIRWLQHESVQILKPNATKITQFGAL